MSYYIPKIWADIIARLKSDTSLTALVPSIFYDRQPNNATLPLINVNLASITPGDSFTDFRDLVQFDVHLWMEREGFALDGGDPFNTAATTLERILGDWVEQTGRVPTYGIEHWQPTLTGTGYNSTWVTRSSGPMEEHNEDTLHWIFSFQTYISKATP